ncbi:MAG TPA: hypothetical protein V6C63_20120 [Allocoleopsis sp.]
MLKTQVGWIEIELLVGLFLCLILDKVLSESVAVLGRSPLNLLFSWRHFL